MRRFKSLEHAVRALRRPAFFGHAERDDPDRLKRHVFASKNNKKHCFDLQKHANLRSPRKEDRVKQAQRQATPPETAREALGVRTQKAPRFRDQVPHYDKPDRQEGETGARAW